MKILQFKDGIVVSPDETHFALGHSASLVESDLRVLLIYMKTNYPDLCKEAFCADAQYCPEKS